MAEALELPGSSFSELCKIIKGYSHADASSSMDDLAKLMGINKSIISRNSKFLTEIGVITGGHKKSATELGRKLGRALDHNHSEDTKKYWKESIQGSENLSGLITTVRIKGGMKEEDLSNHILYISGQKKNKDNATGSRAIVDILLAADLLIEKDGTLTIATPTENPQPLEPEPVFNSSTVTVSPPSVELPLPPQYHPTPVLPAPSLPSIAINIQLHLPETDNAEVYEKLFKALREQLISPKE